MPSLLATANYTGQCNQVHTTAVITPSKLDVICDFTGLFLTYITIMTAIEVTSPAAKSVFIYMNLKDFLSQSVRVNSWHS